MNDFTSKTISAQALMALKEALTQIYWFKRETRRFIELTIKNNSIVATIDWETNVKYESISQLVDRMAARKDIYFEDLLLLIQEVANFNDFSHLKKCEDSEKKIRVAKESVQRLRNQSAGYFQLIEEKRQSEERRIRNLEKIKESISSQQKLEILKKQFYSITKTENHQQRGYDFEKFLIELFALFDLDPRASFKLLAEQIDGAFTFDNQDYLLEAKWQNKKISDSDLSTFAGKISEKFKTAVGLYISYAGFSSECLRANKSIWKSMILMDGADIIEILEGREKLPDQLYRKRRHASETGEIFDKTKKI